MKLAAGAQKLPAPLNSKKVDCRGLAWMPFYGDRLFNSAFDAAASPEEFRVALLLWWRAFQSVPAGSLADDDFELAKAAGFGRDVQKWFGVKHAALHNFLLCSDGRLYHPVVCEIAMQQWKRRTNALKRMKKLRAVAKTHATRDVRVTCASRDAHVTRLEERRGEEKRGEESTKKRRVPPLTPPPRVRRAARLKTSGAIAVPPAAPGEAAGPLTGELLSPGPKMPDAMRVAFERWWTEWPRERRTGKKQAAKAYLVARKEASEQELLDGLRQTHFDLREPRFIPHPSTWLNSGRWLDDPAAHRPKPSTADRIRDFVHGHQPAEAD